MQYLKSLLFVIFINCWGAIIPIVFLLPAFIFKSKKIGDYGAKIWSQFSFYVLKKLCKIEYKIIGQENILNEPCIYACKHQSMWETVVMHLILNRPVYAYKKELEKIPFYGWFLKFMSGIGVDRKGGMKSLKNVISQAKFYLNKGQSVVIFPQGTRVPVGESVKDFPYQAGITALYNSCETKIVPVALNSGLYWSKHKILKNPGVIIIEFLPAINQGLSKDDFNKKLISAIEDASNKLAIVANK
ncbi:MAG: lysophospholipid acyltransferase family protein [Rickettsiales bacterium]